MNLLLLPFVVLAAPMQPGECWPQPVLPHVQTVAAPVGDAFRIALHDEVTVAHTTVVSWSDARKFLYKYYAHPSGDGTVWDAYGEEWLRGPELGVEEKLVNIEHHWPQSRFAGWEAHKPHGSLAKNWRKALEGDLHNLYTTSELLNSKRGNKPFAELPDCGTPSCDGPVSFEPPAAHKGNAARAMFYMAVRYGYEIPDSMERDLRAWDLSDPPDDAERARNDAIAAVQGNRNPFIDEPGLVARIADL